MDFEKIWNEYISLDLDARINMYPTVQAYLENVFKDKETITKTEVIEILSKALEYIKKL